MPPAAASPSAASQGSSGTATASSSRELAISQRLQDAGNLNLRQKQATDLRDGIDQLPSNPQAYAAFCDVTLPTILALLAGPVELHASRPEHRFRLTLLEVINRLTHEVPLKPHAIDIVTVLFRLIREDSEDIAIVALKTVIDFYRTFKDVLIDTMNDFLSIVKENIQSMPDVVDDTFNDAALAAAAKRTSVAPSPAATTDTKGKGVDRKDAQPQQQPEEPLPVGLHSFKVLSECPIAIVFLFQSYKQCVPVETKIFVPMIFEFLKLTVPAQVREHQAIADRGEIFCGIAEALQPKRAAYNSFLVAQVKAMSFLAYVLRVSPALLMPHKDDFPLITIRMLKDFGPESIANRKVS